MTNIVPPDDAADQELDVQELLEWRDLQNAQIESMKHVWDNPQDECWNDVPLNTPATPPESTYFGDYTDLTDAQHDLFDRMSEISEECLCAGWIGDNEYNIWNAITLGSPAPGYGPINPRLLRRCQRLSSEIGGWIQWTTEVPKYVPMAQWLALVDARRKLAATSEL